MVETIDGDGKPLIDFEDQKKKSNLWRVGVLLYGMAVPLVITTNFIYFVPLSKFTKMFSKDILKAHPLLHITNQSFRDDVNEKIEIYYSRIFKSKEYDDHHSWDNSGWRQNFVMWCVLVPAICLTFDMLFNKIHIRFA